MKSGLLKEISVFCLIIASALVVGFLFNILPLSLLIAATLYFILTVRSALRLNRWIKDGMPESAKSFSGIWQDIHKLLIRQRLNQTEAYRKMRQAVKRVSQVTHAIDEGIILLQKDLSLDRWNTAARKMLKLHSSDKGNLLTHLIRDPRLTEYLEQADIKGSVELPSRVQSDITLVFTASRFGAGEVVVVVSDITRLKNLEKLRKEFVGNVSHELRTPITVLRGYLETLTDGMIMEADTLQKAYSQMSDQVLRMQALADDLVVLSRLEGEPANPKLKKVKVKPLLENILKEAEMISEGKHMISLDCPEDVTLMAQKSDLHSAIGNIVINAIRHNPEGANVAIKVVQEKNKVSISVVDDGVGIGAAAINRLTERFYRADTSRNSMVPGTGLGLAIVKHILNRYGGTLDIHSKPGEGATFTSHFPV